MKLTYRHASIEDAPDLWHLLNEHKHHFLDDFSEVEAHWVKDLSESPDLWVIVDRLQVIGAIWFSDIKDTLHATAHILITPRYWLAVIRSRLIETIVTEAFTVLNVRKFKAMPLVTQKTGIKLLKRMGFFHAGTLWGETLVKKRPVSLMIFEIQKKRWLKTHGATA